MALGDYICCCKCDVKLFYDGDRGQRKWWEERFGKPPEIECPDCKASATQPSKPWVGLTYGEVLEQKKEDPVQFYRAIEAKLREKNA